MIETGWLDIVDEVWIFNRVIGRQCQRRDEMIFETGKPINLERP
jgi:hypothetical protein